MLLIGGTSHVGKSTLARLLADDLGWSCITTDALARHPGRPWPAPSEEVSVHYHSLSVDDLADAQWRHYQRLWPTVEALVCERLDAAPGRGLVLEGSGVLPEKVASLDVEQRVAAVWLTASPTIVKGRIHDAGGYDSADADRRFMIDQFVSRTLRYDELVRGDVAGHGLRLIAADGRSPRELATEALSPAANLAGARTSPNGLPFASAIQVLRKGRCGRGR